LTCQPIDADRPAQERGRRVCLGPVARAPPTWRTQRKRRGLNRARGRSDAVRRVADGGPKPAAKDVRRAHRAPLPRLSVSGRGTSSFSTRRVGRAAGGSTLRLPGDQLLDVSGRRRGLDRRGAFHVGFRRIQLADDPSGSSRRQSDWPGARAEKRARALRRHAYPNRAIHPRTRHPRWAWRIRSGPSAGGASDTATRGEQTRSGPPSRTEGALDVWGDISKKRTAEFTRANAVGGHNQRRRTQRTVVPRYKTGHRRQPSSTPGHDAVHIQSGSRSTVADGHVLPCGTRAVRTRPHANRVRPSSSSDGSLRGVGSAKFEGSGRAKDRVASVERKPCPAQGLSTRSDFKSPTTGGQGRIGAQISAFSGNQQCPTVDSDIMPSGTTGWGCDRRRGETVKATRPRRGAPRPALLEKPGGRTAAAAALAPPRRRRDPEFPRRSDASSHDSNGVRRRPAELRAADTPRGQSIESSHAVTDLRRAKRKSSPLGCAP